MLHAWQYGIIEAFANTRQGRNVHVAGNTASASEKGRATAEAAGKYVTFKLAGEEYGIGILKVKEIILLDIDLILTTEAIETLREGVGRSGKSSRRGTS